MVTLALVARVAVAIVFATAGFAKTRDLQASRDTVTAFGISPAIARVVGTLLPFAELATALALLPRVSARWGALAAVVLLILFTTGVSVALAGGRTPDCNCFGQVSSAQISSRTILRNVGLLVVAAFAAWRAPGSSLQHWTVSLSAANLTAAAGVILGILAAIAALHYRASAARLRLEAQRGDATSPPERRLGVGDEAPEFSMADIEGNPVTLASLLAPQRPLVLVFASPICGPCRALIPELVNWNGSLSESLTLTVIESMVPGPEGLAHDMPPIDELLTLYEPGIDIASAYGVAQTPTAIAIDADGRVVAPPAVGSGAIEQLVRTALRFASPAVTEAA
jgi:uncharacterized membrane protein YphA (DoxX/SURF4 family)